MGTLGKLLILLGCSTIAFGQSGPRPPCEAACYRGKVCTALDAANNKVKNTCMRIVQQQCGTQDFVVCLDSLSKGAETRCPRWFLANMTACEQCVVSCHTRGRVGQPPPQPPAKIPRGRQQNEVQKCRSACVSSRECKATTTFSRKVVTSCANEIAKTCGSEEIVSACIKNKESEISTSGCPKTLLKNIIPCEACQEKCDQLVEQGEGPRPGKPGKGGKKTPRQEVLVKMAECISVCDGRAECTSMNKVSRRVEGVCRRLMKQKCGPAQDLPSCIEVMKAVNDEECTSNVLDNMNVCLTCKTACEETVLGSEKLRPERPMDKVTACFQQCASSEDCTVLNNLDRATSRACGQIVSKCAGKEDVPSCAEELVASEPSKCTKNILQSVSPCIDCETKCVNMREEMRKTGPLTTDVLVDLLLDAVQGSKFEQVQDTGSISSEKKMECLKSCQTTRKCRRIPRYRAWLRQLDTTCREKIGKLCDVSKATSAACSYIGFLDSPKECPDRSDDEKKRNEACKTCMSNCTNAETVIQTNMIRRVVQSFGAIRALSAVNEVQDCLINCTDARCSVLPPIKSIIDNLNADCAKVVKESCGKRPKGPCVLAATKSAGVIVCPKLPSSDQAEACASCETECQAKLDKENPMKVVGEGPLTVQMQMLLRFIWTRKSLNKTEDIKKADLLLIAQIRRIIDLAINGVDQLTPSIPAELPPVSEGTTPMTKKDCLKACYSSVLCPDKGVLINLGCRFCLRRTCGSSEEASCESNAIKNGCQERCQKATEADIIRRQACTQCKENCNQYE